MKSVEVNEQVMITALGFRKNLIAYPKRMEYKGMTYSFLDSGLRCLVRKGERIAEILTMTDGVSEFRLRGDQGNRWTLLSILSKSL
jgi:hypothetical protein